MGKLPNKEICNFLTEHYQADQIKEDDVDTIHNMHTKTYIRLAKITADLIIFTLCIR
jgi:hypothetical protein